MTRWLPEKKDRQGPTTTNVLLVYHFGYYQQEEEDERSGAFLAVLRQLRNVCRMQIERRTTVVIPFFVGDCLQIPTL